MTTTIQVVLIIIILFSFIGIMGEKENEQLRKSVTNICAISIVAFMITLFFL